MALKVTYKGTDIIDETADCVKKLDTAGCYMEDDITIDYTGGTAPTLISKSITANGTYNASSDNADGYSSVTVNVGNYDMSCTNNQVKMIIELSDYDKTLWTRFAFNGGSVTVDWGDGNTETFTTSGSINIEYATTQKHTYNNAGKYLVTITATNNTLIVGSINDICTLSEGDISPSSINSNDSNRFIFLTKIKELNWGQGVTIYRGLKRLQTVRLCRSISMPFSSSTTNDPINIEQGTTVLPAYMFLSAIVPIIKVPASVVSIENNAFDTCLCRIIDFTDTELDSGGNLPITISATNVFRGSSSTFIVFATQEIAEVAKQSTNWSVYASRIKYLGELE